MYSKLSKLLIHKYNLHLLTVIVIICLNQLFKTATVIDRCEHKVGLESGNCQPFKRVLKNIISWLVK